MKGVIFTYVMTYGGALASLFNPYIGLLIYIGFSILKPEALWHWQAADMPSNSSRIVAIALLVGWILRGGGNWALGRAWVTVVAFVTLLAWTAVSTLQAANPDVAWGYSEEMLKIVLPFLVGITTIDSYRKIKGLAWVMVVSQGYIALELNLSYLTEGFNAAAEYGFGGMDNNSLSVAMNTGIGLAAFLGLATRNWWLKLVAVAAAGAMTHVVLLSFSRGGMLGLLATGAVAFLVVRKTAWHYLVFVVAGLVLLRFAGPQVQERFFTIFSGEETRDASADGRIKLWQDAFDMMCKHPIFGVGPRHFPIHAPEYGWPFGKEAHTLWLQAGAEKGMPGLGLLVLFYMSTLWPLWRVVRSKTVVCDEEMRSIGYMVIASLVGFAVSAQFVSLKLLEIPYYVTLIGALTLKLASEPASVPVASASPEMVPVPEAA